MILGGTKPTIPTIPDGFRNEMNKLEPDTNVMLILADWLDEREINHRIRQFLQYQEIVPVYPLNEVYVTLTIDETYILVILCLRRLLWDKLNAECKQAIRTAELWWCDLASVEDIEVDYRVLNNARRHSDRNLSPVVEDLLWAIKNNIETPWLGAAIGRIIEVTRQEEWVHAMRSAIKRNQA